MSSQGAKCPPRSAAMTTSLYDQDFYTWANQQAALLRSGRLTEADIANIAEEIESMGRGEKRELVNRLAELLHQLLKWQFQPSLRGNSWRLKTENTRYQLEDHLDDNPSLRTQLGKAMRDAYRLSRIEAERETGLTRGTFPTDCPYTYEQVMNPEFWPE
jgi:hypothetical protein